VTPILQSLKLIRVVNCLLASIGVWAGAYMTLEPISWPSLILVASATFCICAAGNVFNDLRDIEIDKIAHPARGLTSGKLSAEFAFRLGIGLNLIGLILPLFVNFASDLVAVAAVALLLAYNYRLKRLPLVGNLVIALLTGGTLVMGGVATSVEQTFDLPGPLIPALYAIFLHLMREIVKDILDIEGDRTNGLRTIPIVWGVRASLVGVFVLSICLSAAVYWPVLLEWFGYRFGYLAGIGVCLPVVVMSISALVRPSTLMLKVFSVVLKVVMGIGLFALFLA
jgi:geranylgeranylglycerol-phosphate geranylgeranyltransferase